MFKNKLCKLTTNETINNDSGMTRIKRNIRKHSSIMECKVLKCKKYKKHLSSISAPSIYAFRLHIYCGILKNVYVGIDIWVGIGNNPLIQVINHNFLNTSLFIINLKIH